MKKNGPTQRELEIAEIAAIMRTASGRNLMFRILNESGVESDTFDSDPIIHARNAGRRLIGLWLKRELKAAALSEYQLMMKENMNAT